METILVKDIMIPLEQYATVSEDATVAEAVMALLKSQEQFPAHLDPSRAILVVSREGHVVGKISQIDIVRALEPGYGKVMGPNAAPARIGFSSRFLKLVADDFRLWDKPLEELCRKLAHMSAKQIMYAPASEGEYVHEMANLNEAIHQLLMGHHQSLLVVRRGKITGILRLTDVFRIVAETISKCKPPSGNNRA
ncbi:MAG: CBS domain-containing protein [Thermodesulfobacteriota bacterium]